MGFMNSTLIRLREICKLIIITTGFVFIFYFVILEIISHEVLPWLQTNNGFISAIVNVILVYVTYLYVNLTNKLVQEARETRISQIQEAEKMREMQAEEAEKIRFEQNKPCVKVCIERNIRIATLVEIFIENIGAGTAFDVTFDVKSDLKAVAGVAISKLGFFKYNFDYLSPGQRHRSLLISIVENPELLNSEGFIITSKYKNSYGKEGSDNSIVDFRIFENTGQIRTSEENTAISVEEINNTLKQAFSLKK